MAEETTKTIKNISDSIISWVGIATIFLMPIFFNPWAADLFDLNKRLLLSASASIMIIVWMIRNIATKSVRLTLTPFTVPLVLLTGVSLVSSYGSLPEAMESFITTTSTISFLTAIYLVQTTLRANNTKTTAMLTAFIASGVTLALLGFLELLGFGPSFIISSLGSNIANNSSIFLSPAGSAVSLVATLVPALIASLIMAVNQNSAVEKILLFLASAVIGAGLFLAIFNILPGKPNTPIFLSYSASWQVAAENIKRPTAFIMGVGPGNYQAAFSINKPAGFNIGDFWNTRFAAARNVPLHLFTTTGIIGLASWLALVFGIIKFGRNFNSMTQTAKTALVTAGSIVVINLLLPPNTVLTSVFVFLLIIISLELRRQKDPATSELVLKLFAAKLINSGHKDAYTMEDQTKKPKKSELLPLIIGIPVALLFAANLYGSYRVMAADIYLKKSLSAAAANDGTNTYENQRMAITQNPYLSAYHRSYANTNLALAGVISSQEELTDQDRNNITTLIQQAIREAKTAVQINPKNPANWETLAATYRNLINVAEGSTDWTTASYLEAIRRDPRNPRLRLELGGVYFGLQDYQNAIRLFQQASELKPNWANAHYNLAVAYRENNELQRAVSSYDLVLSLVEPSSQEYQLALAEQNQIKQRLGEEVTQPSQETQTGELQEPAPLPTPLPQEEQIQLNEEEAAPPAGSGEGFNELVEPSPTPTPEPTQ